MDGNYSVGNLVVDIGANTTKSVKEINKVIRRLNSLQATLNALDGTNVSTFAKSLSGMTSAFSKENIDNISKFSRRLTNLGKKLASTNLSDLKKGFGELTIAITPFVNKIKKAQDGLIALSNIMNKTTGKKFSKVLGVASGKGNKSNSFGGLARFSKMGVQIYAARRLARVLGSIVQYGVDYTETLNLWQVAMRDNLAVADEFVKKMNKAYGISTKTVMSAQATFRNMIGSLGDLSSETSYILSESITQMALDYASLYNTSIEEAINKFQSALAGQVRPIRSISGYDITEKTIHALYQSLGGTKTQRQLSRTEKQLLAIYAVFNQMGASGALGDMTKTIGNFANQSRMLRENWAELATWIGIGATYLLEELGIMVKLNAFLITAKEIIKTLVYAGGYQDKNFATAWASDVEATNKAVDELQGKLLDFDKFRSLSGSEENVLQIDQALLKAMQGYSSVIDESANKSQQIANSWLATLGFVDENNDGIYEITGRAEKFFDVIKSIGVVLGTIIAYNLIAKIGKLIKWITGLKTATAGLNAVLATGIVWSIIKAVEAFKEGDKTGAALAVTVGTRIVGAWVLLNAEMLKTKGIKIAETFVKLGNVFKKETPPALNTLKKSLIHTRTAVTGLQTATAMLSLSFAAGSLAGLLASEATAAEKTAGAFIGLAAALTAAAIAYYGFQQNWAKAVAIGGVVAGGFWTVSNLAFQKFGDGGLPDKGTMFIAGEAGAEMLYNMPSGQSGVANIEQIQQAMYGAMVAYGKTQGNGGGSQPVDVYIDGEKVFQVTQKNARRHGVGFAKM